MSESAELGLDITAISEWDVQRRATWPERRVARQLMPSPGPADTKSDYAHPDWLPHVETGAHPAAPRGWPVVAQHYDAAAGRKENALPLPADVTSGAVLVGGGHDSGSATSSSSETFAVMSDATAVALPSGGYMVLPPEELVGETGHGGGGADVAPLSAVSLDGDEGSVIVALARTLTPPVASLFADEDVQPSASAPKNRPGGAAKKPKKRRKKR